MGRRSRLRRMAAAAAFSSFSHCHFPVSMACLSADPATNQLARGPVRHEDSVEAEWTTAAVVSNPLHSSIRQSGMAYWRVAFPLSLSWHVDRVIVCHCYPAFPFPPGGGNRSAL